MAYPALTKDGETVMIVKKEAINGEKELFTAEDGRVFTRSMDAQALQLVEEGLMEEKSVSEEVDPTPDPAVDETE